MGLRGSCRMVDELKIGVLGSDHYLHQGRNGGGNQGDMIFFFKHEGGHNFCLPNIGKNYIF